VNPKLAARANKAITEPRGGGFLFGGCSRSALLCRLLLLLPHRLLGSPATNPLTVSSPHAGADLLAVVEPFRALGWDPDTKATCEEHVALAWIFRWIDTILPRTVGVAWLRPLQLLSSLALVWNVVDQITGVFSLGFLGVEGEPVRAQGPGSPTPHAHPVLVALLGIGEQPCLLWAFKASH